MKSAHKEPDASQEICPGNIVPRKIVPQENFAMSQDVHQDQLVLIRIEGMHCHRCEQTIQQALSRHPGVREVEIDFASGQASVLFDRGTVTTGQLAESIVHAGYKVTGFAQREMNP